MTNSVRRSWLLCVAGVLLAGSLHLHAQTPPPKPQETRMKTFVLIARATTRVLTPEENQRRAEDIRAWAQKQAVDGRKLDPRLLVDEGQLVGVEVKPLPAPVASEGRIATLLFLEAVDLADAVKVAQTHPGTRYGATFEVRPWNAPAAAPK